MSEESPEGLVDRKAPRSPSDYIYIYYIKGECYMFDRTVDREGFGPARARARVEELEGFGLEAFYVIGQVLPGALV